MGLWILALIIGLLVITGIVVSVTNLTSADNTDKEENIDCETCGNSCSAERNCGLQSCGAVQGRNCGCGR